MIKKPIALFRYSPRKPACVWRFVLAGLLSLKACVTAAPNEGLVFGVEDSRRVGKSDLTSADNTEGLSLPYSQILRDAEPPYENLFRDVRVGGRLADKVGPGDVFAEARLFRGPRMNVPLASRGMQMEDAEFKLGRFYLDLRALSASVLYSDNIDLTEQNRDDGLIGIVRLTSVMLFQITDNVRLAVHGTLVYLPFRGEVGVAGFGITDPWMEFETVPLFQTQLTLDQRVGGWDVEFIDEVRVRYRQFGAGWGFDVFDGETFDEEDRAGRYVFRDRSGATSGGGWENRDDRIGDNYIEGRNLVGASAGRLLPTVTRFEFGGYHSDYWYDGTYDSSLPRSRDTVYAMLASQRETLRFKPFVRYRTSKNNNWTDWDSEVRGGVHGPVTENLYLLADGGYYWGYSHDFDTYLARVRLRHTLNPLTYHQLEGRHDIAETTGDLEESLTYLLRHVFRDNLSGELYGSIGRCVYWGPYYRIRSPNVGSGGGDGVSDRGEVGRAGARLYYDLAEHIRLRLSGAYMDFHNLDKENDDFKEWIGRGEILYRHTASLQTRFIYQYRNRHAEMPGDSFRENLVALTLSKFF